MLKLVQAESKQPHGPGLPWDGNNQHLVPGTGPVYTGPYSLISWSSLAKLAGSLLSQLWGGSGLGLTPFPLLETLWVSDSASQRPSLFLFVCVFVCQGCQETNSTTWLNCIRVCYQKMLWVVRNRKRKVVLTMRELLGASN